MVMSPRTFGILIALVTLVLDQASKLWVLFVFDLPIRGRVPVLPFTDLVMVWNRGVSYGLFQQHTDVGRWLLIAVTLAVSLFLARWLWRETDAPNVIGLGLVLGGAIGNGIDRVAYGAVADFVLLHAGGFEWYVFNVADAAIVVGVVFLLYGALPIGRRGDARSAERAGPDTTT
jgi:signal peptidase II